MSDLAHARALFAPDRRRGLLKSAIAAILTTMVCLYAFDRFTLHSDGQVGGTSLDFRHYVVDSYGVPSAPGHYVAFRVMDVGPVLPNGKRFYPNGTVFGKQVFALPGDHVTVTKDSVSVNGRVVARNEFTVLDRIAEDPQHLVTRDEVVPDGHLFVLGTHPRSLDSRFIGFVPEEWVIGRMYALW